MPNNKRDMQLFFPTTAPKPSRIGMVLSPEGIYKNEASRKASLWGKLHPERRTETRKRWAKSNPAKVKECSRRHYYKNHTRIREKCNAEYATKGRDRLLRYDYGITLQEYNRLFQIQGGMCAICKRHQSQFKYSLHVDHDHKTKLVRGLLCAKCNTDLGPMENAEWKATAEHYLKQYGNQ